MNFNQESKRTGFRIFALKRENPYYCCHGTTGRQPVNNPPLYCFFWYAEVGPISVWMRSSRSQLRHLDGLQDVFIEVLGAHEGYVSERQGHGVGDGLHLMVYHNVQQHLLQLRTHKSTCCVQLPPCVDHIPVFVAHPPPIQQAKLRACFLCLHLSPSRGACNTNIADRRPSSAARIP